MPIMKHLRDVTGENTAHHELRDGKRGVSKRWSKKVLRDTILIGDQFPAQAGATGKLLLAHLPREELKKYLNSPKSLTRLTPRTINDPKKLLSELARVKKRGAPVIQSKSNSAREPREIYNGSDKRIEKKRMFV